MDTDEMDSLFEGMVLIDPTQPSPSPSSSLSTQPSTPTFSDNSVHQPEPPSSPPADASRPLDENLFSDLTLVTPQIHQTLAPPSPITTKSISRQVSNTRKKKRPAGLRIGYKKDEIDSVADSVVTTPPSTQVPEQVRVSQVENHDKENHDKEVESKAKTVDDEIHSHLVPNDAEKLHVDVIRQDEDRDWNHARFERIKSQITENLRRVREMVDSVSEKRTESIRRRRKAAEDLSLASSKHRELERQLEEACEAEDFEMADRLSDSIASADSEKERLAVALRDADAECDAVDVKMQGVLHLQIAAEEECASLLQRFSMDAAKDADMVLRNAELTSSKEINKWELSVEMAEVKRMELDAESFIVNEARQALNDSVDHLVEDDKREIEILHRKKEELTDELERLLALVKQKESELKENESSIEIVEKRISNAVSGFQEAQSCINTKYNNLQSELSQIELQNEALSRKREEVDECFSQEQGRAVKSQNLAKTSGDEANMYQEVAGLRKNLIQFILSTREHKLMFAKTGDKLTEDVQMLKQDISPKNNTSQPINHQKNIYELNPTPFNISTYIKTHI